MSPEDLGIRISELNEPDTPFQYLQRLGYWNSGNRIHLEFFGEAFDDGFRLFCETISTENWSAQIASIRLDSPDEGANGTNNWDISQMTRKDGYPALETFIVQLNRPGEHNRRIIGADYDEEGMIAKFCKGSPRLRYLEVPSAPSPDFLKCRLANLECLSIDAGYSTQDFLQHFAKKNTFPSLRRFEWGEWCEDHMEEDLRSPFQHYRKLFNSSQFKQVDTFVLRNSTLTEDQKSELLRLHPDLQFMVITNQSSYVG